MRPPFELLTKKGLLWGWEWFLKNETKWDPRFLKKKKKVNPVLYSMQKKILKDCEAAICCNKHHMIRCSSSGPCRLCYLSAAGQAVSWFQCPATLQPGSWADYQYCWLPAGGSAGSEGADTTLGISVRQNHLYRDLWWPFAQRLIIYK